MPGDLNTFFFTLGGAEANENAIKAARLFTGRHKILARYRSYHGATHGAMSLTGDPRRWPNEPGMPGVVHVMDPEPYDYSFGTTDEERTTNNLRYLEEVIQYEGPHTIAAMFIETVTGTNGILVAAEGLPARAARRCSRSTASCSSATRSCAAWAAPARSSRSSTATSSRTSSPWPRA